MKAEFQTRQFISMQSLKDAGYSHYRINELVDQGRLAKINRSYYENTAYEGETNDFYAVPAYTNDKGVICLLTAAVYYELTTERTTHLDVALARRSRVPLSPEWPQMAYYLFSEERYKTGIETVTQDGNTFFVYNREKTVCDLIFYRNKLGFEPAVEVLKNYLKRKDRDLIRLMRYAEILHVKTAMKQYLEVLV